jgi:hypothetical protein
MERTEAATETNASTEDARVQYVNCHRLSDEEKRQLWASQPKEGDVVNGKADREKASRSHCVIASGRSSIQLYRPFERVCLSICWSLGLSREHARNNPSRLRKELKVERRCEGRTQDGEGRYRENVTKVNCPFIIRSTFVNGSRASNKWNKDDLGKDNRVSIKKCEFLTPEYR